MFTLNVNYIQLNYYSIYHTPSDFTQLWFCSQLRNSNELGRVTSQSKVENKPAPYGTAAMIFTGILDLEARRKAKEASKARRRKIHRLKQQQRMRQFLVKQALTFVLAFLLIVVDQTVFSHKAIKSLVSSNHYVSAILVNHAL